MKKIWFLIAFLVIILVAVTMGKNWLASIEPPVNPNVIGKSEEGKTKFTDKDAFLRKINSWYDKIKCS